MLNPRGAGGISNFMQSYNHQQMVQQQVHSGNQFVQNSQQATQSISNSVSNNNNNQYEYSIPGEAIYSTSNLSQFKN